MSSRISFKSRIAGYLYLVADEIWDILETMLSLVPTGFGCMVRGLFVGFLAKGGHVPYIRRNCHIFRPWKMKIGKNISLGRFSSINAVGGIEFGDNVRVGPGVMISTLNHRFENKKVPIVKQGAKYGKVVIGSDVWVGGNASIMAGINIGEGAVIAAGAVVTHHVEAYTVVAGVPARKIKTRL